MTTDTLTRTRESYVYLISKQTIPGLKAPPHDFAEQVFLWLSHNMPEELEGDAIDKHAVEVAAVHLGLCD